MATSQIQTHTFEQDSPSNNRHIKKSKSPTSSLQSPRLNIPLITKHMNFVEKYIKDFDKEQNNQHKISHNYLTDRIPVNRSISSDQEGSLLAKHFKSVDGDTMTITEPKQLAKKSCIKYSTIRDQKSEQKLESLEKMEVQYLRLKDKAHLPKSFLPSITTSRKRSDPAVTISYQEVQRQIKKSIITKGGQRYFADLYLMKKGRDKIITSLASVGKHTLTGNTHSHSHSHSHNQDSYDDLIKNSLAYEEQVAKSKQQFVKNKILQDRNAKKGKMLRGRSMNWNVYYQIMALSPSQRNKIKGIQKFEADYGIR